MLAILGAPLASFAWSSSCAGLVIGEEEDGSIGVGDRRGPR